MLLGSAGLGIVKGGHVEEMITALSDTRNALANSAGFRITAVAINGRKQLTQDEVLAIGGVNGRSSLLFLDAAMVRDKLKANPWIGEATVQKFYPASCRSTSPNVRPSRCGSRTAGYRSSPMTARCWSPMWRAASRPAADRRQGCRDPRQGFPRAARPLSASAFGHEGCGVRRRAPLEPAAQGWPRRAAAGERHRQCAGGADRDSTRKTGCSRATSLRSTCGWRTG